MIFEQIMKVIGALMEQGQLATRVATSLIVTLGIVGAGWTASEKWATKADKDYVDHRLAQVGEEISLVRSKANFAHQKLMESTIATIAILKKKLESGNGTQYDRDQLKFLEEELGRMRQLQRKD